MEYFENNQRIKIHAIVDKLVMQDYKKFKFIGVKDFVNRGTCIEVEMYRKTNTGIKYRCDLSIYPPNNDGIIIYSLFDYFQKRTVYEGSVDKTYIEGKI